MEYIKGIRFLKILCMVDQNYLGRNRFAKIIKYYQQVAF